MFLGVELIRRVEEGEEGAVPLDGDDIQAVVRADVQLNHVLAEPGLRRDDLIQRAVGAEVKEVKDIIRGGVDGEPDGGLLLGEDDLVRPAAAEKLRLALVIGLAEDALRAELVELVGDLKAVLKTVADADKAGVKLLNAEGLEHVGIGAVADLGAGGEGDKVAHGVAVDVGDDELTAHIRERAAEMMAKGAGSDD